MGAAKIEKGSEGSLWKAAWQALVKKTGSQRSWVMLRFLGCATG